jgi:hypothetical protein
LTKFSLGISAQYFPVGISSQLFLHCSTYVGISIHIYFSRDLQSCNCQQLTVHYSSFFFYSIVRTYHLLSFIHSSCVLYAQTTAACGRRSWQRRSVATSASDRRNCALVQMRPAWSALALALHVVYLAPHGGAVLPVAPDVGERVATMVGWPALSPLSRWELYALCAQP